MNKYKIEFKQIFNRLVTIYAEDEEQAMKVVEQTYLKTDLLDDNEKDLVGIEAKILEKNGEKVDRKEEIPENFENFLDENDIEYLEGLTNEIEENLGEIKEVLGANMVEAVVEATLEPKRGTPKRIILSVSS